jgi:hypothetical protein
MGTPWRMLFGVWQQCHSKGVPGRRVKGGPELPPGLLSPFSDTPQRWALTCQGSNAVRSSTTASPIPRPGEVEYEIVPGRHGQGMIAEIESEIPPDPIAPV